MTPRLVGSAGAGRKRLRGRGGVAAARVTDLAIRVVATLRPLSPFDDFDVSRNRFGRFGSRDRYATSGRPPHNLLQDVVAWAVGYNLAAIDQDDPVDQLQQWRPLGEQYQCTAPELFQKLLN